jgi:hypothetical protein
MLLRDCGLHRFGEAGAAPMGAVFFICQRF